MTPAPDGAHREPAARRSPRRRRQSLTTNDANRFAAVLAVATGLIATMRTDHHRQPVDVLLDRLDPGSDGGPVRLHYQHVDDTLRPAPETRTVDVADIAHIHLW
jgi:hypothetical protein